MAPQKGAAQLKVPERWGSSRKGVDQQLSKLGTKARDAVAKAGKDPERVMEALSEFFDGWWETQADDAGDAVRTFLVALVDASGSDVDADDAWEELSLGLYGLEGIDTQTLLETVGELEDVEEPDADAMLGAFLDQVADGLVRYGRAVVPGFGTFSVDETPRDEEASPWDVQVGFSPEPTYAERLTRAHTSQELEEPDEEATHRGVVEALSEAFLNGWAVDIEGLGTMACHWEEDHPEVVFKTALELREDILESAKAGSTED
jgi:nucleoid DNA-binding protein